MGTPKPWAIPIRATPIVPAVPHDVPVNSDTNEQSRQAVTRKKRGEIECRPSCTKSGMVPAAIQVLISAPTLTRIKTAGIALAMPSMMPACSSAQL